MAMRHVEVKHGAQLFVNKEPVPVVRGIKKADGQVFLQWTDGGGIKWEGIVRQMKRTKPGEEEGAFVEEVRFWVPEPRRVRRKKVG